MKLWIMILFLLTAPIAYAQEQQDVPFADVPEFWKRVETVFLDSSVAAVNSELQAKRFVVIVRDTGEWRSEERVSIGSRRLILFAYQRVPDMRVLVTIPPSSPSCFPLGHYTATRCDACRNDQGFDAMVELMKHLSFPETFESTPDSIGASPDSGLEWKIEINPDGTRRFRIGPVEDDETPRDR